MKYLLGLLILLCTYGAYAEDTNICLTGTRSGGDATVNDGDEGTYYEEYHFINDANGIAIDEETIEIDLNGTYTISEMKLYVAYKHWTISGNPIEEEYRLYVYDGDWHEVLGTTLYDNSPTTGLYTSGPTWHSTTEGWTNITKVKYYVRGQTKVSGLGGANGIDIYEVQAWGTEGGSSSGSYGLII